MYETQKQRDKGRGKTTYFTFHMGKEDWNNWLRRIQQIFVILCSEGHKNVIAIRKLKKKSNKT